MSVSWLRSSALSAANIVSPLHSFSGTDFLNRRPLAVSTRFFTRRLTKTSRTRHDRRRNRRPSQRLFDSAIDHSMRMPERARLITSCWICSVPSKMSWVSLGLLHGLPLVRFVLADQGKRWIALSVTPR